VVLSATIFLYELTAVFPQKPFCRRNLSSSAAFSPSGMRSNLTTGPSEGRLPAPIPDPRAFFENLNASVGIEGQLHAQRRSSSSTSWVIS
jgi:hypothetical protein